MHKKKIIVNRRAFVFFNFFLIFLIFIDKKSNVFFSLSLLFKKKINLHQNKKGGLLPRFGNTEIVYKMFELSQQYEAVHCCNIYDYEDDIPFIYGTPQSYMTKMVSLNAKNCLCS